MTISPQMKSVSKVDYDVMTVKAAETIARSPQLKELAAHIAELSTILDRMNYNTGTGWEDQAVIAILAMTRAAAWQAAGMPPLVKVQNVSPPANDNDEPPVDDIKLAA